MEDAVVLAAHRRAIEHLIPLLEAIRSVAEIAWRRADRAAEPLGQFATRLRPALARSLARLDADQRDLLLGGWAGDRAVGLLVVGSERGLCGPFNDRLVAEALRQARALTATGQTVQLLGLGGRARRLLETAGQRLFYTRSLPSLTVPSYALTESIALDLLELAEQGRLGRLIAVSNVPTGRFQYQPTTTTLLPPELPADEGAGNQRVRVRPARDALELATHLLTEHLLVGLHRLVIQSTISEQLARISTMRLAVENAERVLERLSLELGLASQQAITTSLLEIVAGYQLSQEQERA
jgi:F-type H+-transporting ATPase subunit gamma